MRRIAGLALRLILVAMTLSILWVGAYRFVDPPATSMMLRDRGRGLDVRHQPVPLSAIAPSLVRSVIAAEDSGFCGHRGFDFDAMSDAWERNQEGGRLRGGSTISQQTAKNAFLWPGRTFVRKGLEAWFTLLIEGLWGKRRIIEIYLNVAEFGPGIYGAEAAARHHFGKPAAQLTAGEAARLAAVLPQPRVRNAGRPGPFVRRHAATIERRATIVRRDGLAACVLG